MVKQLTPLSKAPHDLSGSSTHFQDEYDFQLDDKPTRLKMASRGRVHFDTPLSNSKNLEMRYLFVASRQEIFKSVINFASACLQHTTAPVKHK